jgi:CHAD domain-containing protein
MDGEEVRAMTAADAAAHGELSRLPAAAGTAGAVLQAHLREQLAVLLRLDPQVRAGDAEAVHKMRIATRRLRSALATFRPLVDHERTDPVRDELRWLAGALGTVRDIDVLHERLRTAIADLPTDLVLGPVGARIDSTLAASRRDALARLVGSLDDARYVDLLDSLESLAAQPPLRARATGPAESEVPVLVARTVRRVRRAAEAVDAAPERVVALHQVRKDAKRARYAAEVAAPVVGDKAGRAAKRWKRVQSTLGVLQDSAVARTTLRELAVAAHGAGENGFTFGLLHAREEAAAARATERYEELVRKALKSRPKRWARQR